MRPNEYNWRDENGDEAAKMEGKHATSKAKQSIIHRRGTDGENGELNEEEKNDSCQELEWFVQNEPQRITNDLAPSFRPPPSATTSGQACRGRLRPRIRPEDT